MFLTFPYLTFYISPIYLVSSEVTSGETWVIVDAADQTPINCIESSILLNVLSFLSMSHIVLYQTEL